MKLNFTSLIYFQKAAEMEHLTKAAEALHIAQPALSRTIRGLEEELNVTLFTHKGRNIELTRDGHILLKYTERFLADYDALQQELQDSRDLAQKTVRLAIATATKLIPTFLLKFKKENPGAHVEIVIPQPAGTRKETQQPDLMIFAAVETIENAATVTLFRESLVMITPESDRHAALPYVNLRDFAGASFIAPPAGSMLRSAVERYCGELGFTPQVVMESDNPDTVREFVRAGLGVALVPQMTWYNAQTGVAVLPVGDVDCYRNVYLSWKQKGKMSLTAVLLREYIVDHFWEYVREAGNSIYPM